MLRVGAAAAAGASVARRDLTPRSACWDAQRLRAPIGSALQTDGRSSQSEAAARDAYGSGSEVSVETAEPAEDGGGGGTRERRPKPAGHGDADGPVRAKRPRGPPCAGGPDMGASGSKARGLWPFASAAGGGGPEAAVAEQALVRPRGRVVPPFVFTRRG